MSCPKLTRTGQGVSGPVVLVVMDGVGIGCGDEGDAVAKARAPNLQGLSRGPLSMRLRAHGTAVGMPSDDDMGNSEVGHNALGAGRIFDQGAKLVREAIDSGRVFASPVWQELVANCRRHPAPLHLVGLLSDGNVHSHIDHLLALIDRADAEELPEVYVHVLLDGRDVEKTSALRYIDRLEACLARIDHRPRRRYRIASGGGRMHITMDRYQADWPMVERGWRTHVHGAARGFPSARAAIETYRGEQPGIIDQDLPAFVVFDNGAPAGPIRDGASVIAFNFRGDRMLELCAAFEDDDFAHFDRTPRPRVTFAGMTLYDGDTGRPKRYLVSPPAIRCTLSELLVDAGVTQWACSETQKFGHVTYFWNGNRSGAFDGRLERYVEIPSYPPPFDARPQMRAPEITDAALQALAAGQHRFLRLNYANGDMVGHTGNFDATVAAVECVDACIGRLLEPVASARGALLITADHGNADDMVERDKRTGRPLRDELGRTIPKTSHSLNPVPLYVHMHPSDLVRYTRTNAPQPGLGNLAATLALLLGFAEPTGFLPSLLRCEGAPGVA